MRNLFAVMGFTFLVPPPSWWTPSEALFHQYVVEHVLFHARFLHALHILKSDTSIFFPASPPCVY
jgi:hypothetical protein